MPEPRWPPPGPRKSLQVSVLAGHPPEPRASLWMNRVSTRGDSARCGDSLIRAADNAGASDIDEIPLPA
jgi:hypothetical protein